MRSAAMRDDDRETLIDHRHRLERIEHDVGEILNRLGGLETKVDELKTMLVAQGERLDKVVDFILIEGTPSGAGSS